MARFHHNSVIGWHVGHDARMAGSRRRLQEVVRKLDELGIAAPDAGRVRRDHGQRHHVPGTARQRMAKEKDDARYEALARAFDEIRAERDRAARRVEEAVPAAPPPRRLDLIAAEPATVAHDDHGASLDTPHDNQGTPACCRGPSIEPGAEGGDGTGDGRTDEPISGMAQFRAVSNVGATRFERATSTSRT